MAKKLIKSCLLGKISSSVSGVPSHIYVLLPGSRRHAPLHWLPSLLPVMSPPTSAVLVLHARRVACTHRGGFLLGPRVWATFRFSGCVRCRPVSSGGRLCRDNSRDGAWPPRAVSPATEFLPDGGSTLCWVFSVLIVYSLVVCVFHSVFVVHKYLLNLFVVWSFKGCSCNICVLFRQLLCQICFWLWM